MDTTTDAAVDTLVDSDRHAQWTAERREFAGRIFIRERDEATAEAFRAQFISVAEDGMSQVSVFCDRSAEPCTSGRAQQLSRGGLSVVYKHPLSNYAPPFGGGEGRVALGKQSWTSNRVLSSIHAEMAGIAQALDTAEQLVNMHSGRTIERVGRIKIFTDSQHSLERIEYGARIDRKMDAYGQPERGDECFRYTTPLVRAIIRMSHDLCERGWEVEMHWVPRNTVFAHELADYEAGSWKRELPWKIGTKPSIMGMLHEQVMAALN